MRRAGELREGKLGGASGAVDRADGAGPRRRARLLPARKARPHHAIPLQVASSYIELLDAAAPVTQKHDVLVCVQIDVRRAGREMKRLGGGDEGACLLLLREAASVARRLGSAEIKVFGLLRARQYAGVVRDAFDPFGHQARARSRLGDPRREGVDPELMGPHAEDSPGRATAPTPPSTAPTGSPRGRARRSGRASWRHC
jgi:hypothetical protein